MHNTLKTIFAITIAATGVFAASCQKENTNVDTSSAATRALGNNTARPKDFQLTSLVSSCPTTCVDRVDTLQSDWIPAADVGDLEAWEEQTKYYNLETGEVSSTGSYHFTLSGQFLSRLSSGATLGYFDSTSIKPENFSTISCSHVSAYLTSGVVANSMANYKNVDTVGWYIYNFMNPFLVTPDWIMGIHFSSCNKYYAIKLTVFVTSQGSGASTEYRSNIVVETKCLSCS